MNGSEPTSGDGLYPVEVVGGTRHSSIWSSSSHWRFGRGDRDRYNFLASNDHRALTCNNERFVSLG